MRAGDYRQSVVINYNRGPGQTIRQGDGFAIFLHAHPVATFGCIALDLKNVTKYVKTAQKGDRIIMGVRKDIFTA
jgi:L,D-peptidoglycan transpeptidase YkuD (ErfK/YbiS/YcfS/YnhG family)